MKNLFLILMAVLFSTALNSQNLISDPGFENGGSGWDVSWNASVVSNNARSGSNSTQVGTSGDEGSARQDITGLQPNTTYRLSGYAKVADEFAQVNIGVKDFGGDEISSKINATSYTYGAVTFTTGSNNTTARIYCYKSEGDGFAYGDDFELVVDNTGSSISISEGVHTYQSLSNKTITMTGQSELHFMDAVNPISGCTINLNSEDAWLYIENINPVTIDESYMGQIFINGQPAQRDVNCRLVQFLDGGVIIPHTPTYLALEAFTNTNQSGSSRQFEPYTYYRSAELGSFDNEISSFTLKKGYMATFAQEENGTGYSKVYVADDHDIVINTMHSALGDAVSFVRVIPWRWVRKKGWTSGQNEAGMLNCSWNYNWDNTGSSTLDIEYVPMRHNLGWNSYSNINEIKNTTAVLGFNEPDRPDQADATVKEALAQWPRLLESGLRIGSPSPSDGGLNWLYDFMDQCDELNYRVDFVAMHYYLGCQSAQSFIDRVKAVHDRTGRPIWITEWNNGANWTGCEPTYEEQRDVIRNWLEKLDGAKYVERYSLYEWVGETRGMITDGELTLAGEVYRDQVSPMAYNPNNEFDQPYTALPAPQGLSVSGSIGQLELSWSENSGEDTGVKIERQDAGGNWIEIANVSGSNISSYFDNISEAGIYKYRVRTYNSGGTHSSYSNTADGTIAFGVGDDRIQTGNIDISQSDGNSWAAVVFSEPMAETPIVIAGPPTFNGSDPSTVRVKDVTVDGFKIQLNEWDYLDGSHTNVETMSFLAMTAGNHNLGGISAEVGAAINVDEVWDTIPFTQSFNGVPIVLATQVTDEGSAATAIRMTDISSIGFTIRIQEEEANDDAHYDEEIHYIALSEGTGNIGDHAITVGSTGNNVTANWYTINFGTNYDDPGIFANIQTYVGDDPCALRHQSLSGSSVEVKVEEETSGDAETDHSYAENVGWMVVENISSISNASPINIGQVTADMPNGDTWIPVSFDSPMDEIPVVVMGPPTFNGTDPLTVRIRNVSTNGFEFKLDEWNYLDGAHSSAETVTYLAMLPGTHDLGGITAVAINQNNVDEVWDALSFGYAFSNIPAVVATQVTNSGSATTAIRFRNITTSSFEIRIQEEENQDDLHDNETISIIAFSQGTGTLDGRDIGVGVTGSTYNHEFNSVSFGGTYTNSGLLANIQTFIGGDPSALRYQNLSSSSVEVMVEEEQSADDEVNHNNAESIGWVVIEDVNEVNGARINFKDESPKVVETNKSINFYPNPVHDVLHLTGLESGIEIEIYDILGKKVITANEPEEIPVSHLKSGVYLIMQNNALKVKFIKD